MKEGFLTASFCNLECPFDTWVLPFVLVFCLQSFAPIFGGYFLLVESFFSPFLQSCLFVSLARGQCNFVLCNDERDMLRVLHEERYVPCDPAPVSCIPVV